MSRGNAGGKNRPSSLIDGQWQTAVQGLAGEIQRVRRAHRLLPEVDRVRKFAESPIFAEMTELGSRLIKAKVTAEIVSNMMHSSDEDIASIQTHLDKHPIDALTLLAVIGLEREKEAGALEKKVAEEARAARKQTAKDGASARWAGDQKTAAKNEVYSCWAAWQKKPSSYVSAASFARDMLDKYEALTSQQVVERWCREWAKK
jgi:hypothetical protein